MKGSGAAAPVWRGFQRLNGKKKGGKAQLKENTPLYGGRAKS